MKYLAVLGRQPLISVAELESLYGEVVLHGTGLAEFNSDAEVSIARLGGTLKLARPLSDFDVEKPLDYLLGLDSGKITLGVSDYSAGGSVRKASAEALKLKKILARQGRSVRVLPNKDAVLSTAAVLHNGLGKKPRAVELLQTNTGWWVGCGVQDIDAYARRDQARPARDAKVGMLPPKLAQILINMCGLLKPGARVLDPFCGTGVVLQEAALMGYAVYGTDLNERMISYSRTNLDWIKEKVLSPSNAPSSSGTSFHRPAEKARGSFSVESGIYVADSEGGQASSGDKTLFLEQGDATTHAWQQPIDAVACETYLGPALVKMPSEAELREIKQELMSLLYTFLQNLSSQTEVGIPVTIAIPAWRRPDGSYSRLNILDEIENLGYNVVKYKNLRQEDLLYYREGQNVAREIISLRKK